MKIKMIKEKRNKLFYLQIDKMKLSLIPLSKKVIYTRKKKLFVLFVFFVLFKGEES